MSFVSLTFLAFVAAVLLLYYLVPRRFQWILLLIASVGFYLTAGVGMILFLIFSSAVVYAGALHMQRVRDAASSKKAAKKANKKVLIAELLLNFGILFLLKYYNFLAVNLSALLHGNLPLVKLVLPLGISFYTFQAMGYSIDIYRNKYRAEESYPRFFLFVSFFPQMVQGPISRYSDLGPQLKEEHPFDFQNLRFGLELMLWGYFKKLVIADRAGIVVSAVFGDYQKYDGLQVFVAMVLYAIQIYADFSGGIDMTRGVARAMGIELVDNFAQPYFGNTLAEYWRRWHMSLTNWMRDYVFFPLTLAKFSNRIGKWGRKHLGSIGKQLPSYIPTFVTFTLIGIWHGAGWGFIVFGLFNSLTIILSMALTPLFKLQKKALHINSASFGWRVFGICRTFLILTYYKTISRAPSLTAAFGMWRSSLGLFARSEQSFSARMTALGLNGRAWLVFLLAMAVLFTVSLLRERGMHLRETIAERPLVLRWVLIFGLLTVILVFGVYGEGYSASQFVYRNY